MRKGLCVCWKAAYAWCPPCGWIPRTGTAPPPLPLRATSLNSRMPGASHSPADVNTVLNTIVAQVLDQFADKAGKAQFPHGSLPAGAARGAGPQADHLQRKQRLLAEWVQEAAQRGLLNLPTTADALPCLVAEKSPSGSLPAMAFSASGSCATATSENYAKVVRIEGATLLEMAQRSILPAMIRYQKELLEAVASKRALGIDDQVESALAGRLSDGCIALNAAAALSEALGKLPAAAYEAALHCKEAILPAMGGGAQGCGRPGGALLQGRLAPALL